MLYSTETTRCSAGISQAEDQISHINHFLCLLDIFLKEEIISCKEGNKKLHLKPINALIIEVRNILADTSIVDNLKSTRICILINGLTGYLQQFGLDPNLQQKVIAMCNNCLGKLALTSTMVAFRVSYQKEVGETLLFFALTDGVFSSSILDSLNIDFTKNKPWLVQQPHEFNLEDSNHAETKALIPGLATDASGSFITTVFSQGGFVLSKLDSYTEEFVKQAVTCNGTSFNIGSGYGIPERIALLLGAEKIICNDICAEHLEIIKGLTPSSYHPRLSFYSGSFPDEVDLPNNSIKLIGIFRVLHFLEPDLLVHTIRSIYDLLEPNGVLILSAETPYLKNWQKFMPEYERRIKNNDPWPGYMTDASLYETAGYSKKIPKKMHFLDVATLTRVLIENGFVIEKCTTFDRSTTFPADHLLDGRESVGAIARKTKIKSHL